MAFAKDGLTTKQRVFIDAYLTCWNATEAARRAGYAFPNVEGSKNLVKPSIAAAVRQRIDEMAMTADEVLIRLADHARGDLSPFMRTIDGAVSFDLSTETAAGKMHLIKKVKQVQKRGTNKNGGEWEEEYTEVEIHDPQAALVHIGRHHKLFVDRQEITGKDGNTLVIQYLHDWRGEEGDK